MSKVCRTCGAAADDSAKFCQSCGTKFDLKLFCPQCGQELYSNAAFCSECGTKINPVLETPLDSNAISTGSGAANEQIPAFARIDQPNAEVKINSMINKTVFKRVGIMVAIFTVLLVTGYNMGNYNIESKATAGVNDMLQKNIGDAFGSDFQIAKCVNVKIGTKIDSNTYRATAYLDNGNEMKITIIKRGDGMQIQLNPFQ